MGRTETIATPRTGRPAPPRRGLTGTALVGAAALLGACTSGDGRTIETPATTVGTSAPAVATTRPAAEPGPVDISTHLSPSEARPESSAAEPSGNFRFLCDFSHLLYDDPIVYPGEPGKSHLHMFFGNTTADANSTYDSLRNDGDGTCDGGPVNRSAYWAPAVFNADGKVVVPDAITVYYKGNGMPADQIAGIQEPPKGLRFIAGYDMEKPNATPQFHWYCEQSQEKATTIPTCPADERVIVQLSFPNCWNGKDLDSPDHRAHMAYMDRDPHTGQLSCPKSHPALLPEFTLGLWYRHNGDSRQWHLSSDRMPGMQHANGSTFHSDWFGAWDRRVQRTWTRQCINTMRNCVDGELGDGRHLLDGKVYDGPRLIDAPSPT